MNGIAFTNYYGVTHPSQPNYVASIGGDYFGLNQDGHISIDRSVSTVIDLLESKDISWAQYEEDLPSTGFEGDYYRGDLGTNDYVRKHNPAVNYASVSDSPERLARIKNLSLTDVSRSEFHKDLAANTLPQWMFITPNMTSDGHDTSVTVAGVWARAFLEPLLSDKRFMQRTMVLLTWDESEIDPNTRNAILGVAIGDAIPDELFGTTDDSFYNHYSEIATVSANWDLPTLGRWDVGANVYKWVADRTGDKVRQWCSQTAFKNHTYARPYGGPYNEDDGAHFAIPKPNLALDPSRSGRRILESIRDAWENSTAPTYYKDTIQAADGYNPPNGYVCPSGCDV